MGKIAFTRATNAYFQRPLLWTAIIRQKSGFPRFPFVFLLFPLN